MEEKDFHLKIRKKYWDAYCVLSSHPLFTLPKGGGIGLIDELTADKFLGSHPLFQQVGVLGLKGGE